MKDAKTIKTSDDVGRRCNFFRSRDAPYGLTNSGGVDIIVYRFTQMAKSPAPTVFAPKGAIDLHVSPELRVSLRELIDQKPDRLVIDLSDVPYIDSSGLAVLIGGMQSMEHAGGEFFLAGAQEAVRTIFESARLDQYFHIYPTVDEAVAQA